MRHARALPFDDLLACTRIDQFAPRLARARDAVRAELARVARERETQLRRRRELREEVLKRERLVAHRELQFARACATRNGPYMDQRGRKLASARQELAMFQARLADAERQAA